MTKELRRELCRPRKSDYLYKIQFNNSFAGYSELEYISVQGPSPFPVIHEFVGSKAPKLISSIFLIRVYLSFINCSESLVVLIVVMNTGMTSKLRVVSNFQEQQKYMVSWKDDIHGWCLYNDSCQRAIWSAWTKGSNLLSIKIVVRQRIQNQQTVSSI